MTLDELRQRPTLTAAEAAQVLGVHVDLVTAELRAGRLPGIRIGRVWRVPTARLMALLEAGS